MEAGMARLWALAAGVAGALSMIGSAAAQLAEEPIPAVREMPFPYPDSFVYVIDPNFFGIESGKVVIADVGHEVDHHRGAIGAAQFGSFIASTTRPELYVAETFYARGTRGDRTDVLTIYDKRTLEAAGEVVLPGGKRAQAITEPGMLQLSSDERFMFVTNFTPASSVTVVDLERRAIVGEIDTPGCVNAFPMTKGGFASLCGNGAVMTTRIDAKGRLIDQTMSEPFNDIDADPMFTRAAIIDGVGYFPTYKGAVQPIDFNGDAAKPGEAFSVSAAPVSMPAKQKKPSVKKLLGSLGGKSEPKSDKSPASYLPSGVHPVASDDAGRLYLLMRATQSIDDHDTGGDAVYVVDPKTRAVIRTIRLKGDSVMIELTGGAKPMLVAVGMDMSLDVYDAETGALIRNIGGLALTPFGLMANK
jgi:methylamine dehydrogenase heavy chain